MGRFTITRRDIRRLFNISTGQLHIFQLGAMPMQVIEVEDAHFNHDSAVLLPEFSAGCVPEGGDTNGASGIAALAAVLTHARDNPDKKALIVGHTDTSGPDDYNVELSHLRAENVLMALIGDRDAWVPIADDKHKVKDYQQILRFVSWLWGWPCDPQGIDNDHGDRTDSAVEAFQEMAGAELEEEISVDGDVGPQTWGAIFDVYMRVLCDVLHIEPDKLTELQQGLVFADASKKFVGCGEHFPIEARGQDNFRSETNRRVEVLFFDPGEEPRLLCHASSGVCDPARCDVYAQQTYEPHYLPCPPLRLDPVTLQVAMTEILGLYKPGHSDPDDVTEEETRASGYEPGYKSEDDKGRIFVNHIPRTSASEPWQDIRKKDTQYIEIAVEVTATNGRLPAGVRVQWTWEDPDDPSNAAMHQHASGLVDPNDSGVAVGTDNLGKRDFPKAAADTGAKFEAIEPYGLQDGPTPEVVTTGVVDGVSIVRLHCTNVAGDNFRVTANLATHQLVVPGAQDATGLMTMWKRIDVEYRKMKGVFDLPVAEVPQFFEPCFVQLDITEPQTDPYQEYMGKKDAAFRTASSNYVKGPSTGVFANSGKPGWFLLVAAHRAVEEVGTAKPKFVYEGDATVDEFRFRDGTRGERIVVDKPIAEDIGGVLVKEGSDTLFIPVWSKDDDTPSRGQTSLYLNTMDAQSDFEPGDGRIYGRGGSYEFTDDYYPRHVYKTPSRRWQPPGLGFGRTVQVKVRTKGGYEIGGTSPTNIHRGRKYFAGRTIFFTGHPKYSKDGKLDKAKALSTIVHELGHAFGFPHRCGYYSWEDPPSKSCSMNYFNSWLYTPGTRTLQRFETGKDGQHFCARHLHGIRRVHLEDNPSLWSWP